MKYLSICSGIEAATVAWHPLGWNPFAFSEIESFPSAVLAHHYPHVPNLGDMTKFNEWPDATIDALVGGTPCQSFSVAGLRKGLADPRGNLALVYLAILDRYRPIWCIWENVPGVLSSGNGRDFGAFLGGLVELGYGFAYRVLDAQHVRVDGFGRAVPQRRRRVFVVGYLGDWRRAAAVLFERESLCWDHPPRREAGQGIAPTIASRPTGGGALGTDFDCDGGLISSHDVAQPLLAKSNSSHRADAESYVAHTLNAKGGSGRVDGESETFIAHSLRADGFDASEDGTGRGTPIVSVVAASLTRGAERSGKDGYAWRRQEDDQNLVAFQTRGSNLDIGDISGTLGINSGSASGAAPMIAFDTTQITSPLSRTNPQPGDPCHTLSKGMHPPAIAFDMRGREDGSQFEGPHDTANIRASNGGSSRSYVAQQWAVRRLMPIECERLQGFPDNYTLIKFRGKPAADGPRYKVCGNSMSVNVMRWLGIRIQMVSDLAKELAA
ncbi:MAG: DNA (cytosine-5-)-methyltransferase [Candidatus Hydrogenedentales bacterium]|jgi:DNA (cytosine-5)-methyltransferase 1